MHRPASKWNETTVPQDNGSDVSITQLSNARFTRIKLFSLDINSHIYISIVQSILFSRLGVMWQIWSDGIMVYLNDPPTCSSDVRNCGRISRKPQPPNYGRL